jgi:hypothetical protein
MQQPVYLTRDRQVRYLSKRGIKASVQSLADLARKGRGPQYVLINGRALSTAAWLDEWIASQAARPPQRRKASDEKAAA